MYFVCIWEQTVIFSLYNINRLVFITETECVYCAVRTEYLYIILRSAHTIYLCILCVSENKQWFFSLYNINWLVCITEMECVYCAVRTVYLNVIHIIRRLSKVNTSNCVWCTDGAGCLIRLFVRSDLPEDRNVILLFRKGFAVPPDWQIWKTAEVSYSTACSQYTCVQKWYLYKCIAEQDYGHILYKFWCFTDRAS